MTTWKKLLNATSSGKTCHMEEQTVSSSIIFFHMFVIKFMVETTQGATKKFAVDVNW